jgi:ABC-2 type transport system permease protein
MSDFAVLGKYGKCFSTGVKAAFEYRINVIFSIAGAIAPVVIQTALWIALYSNDANETMFGFTFVQMVSYTVIAQLVSRLVRTGFEYDLDNDIRTGSLDRFLVKPVGYFGFRLFSFLGDKLVQSVMMGLLIAVSVVFLAVGIGFPLTAVNVLFFIVAMLLAFTLNFLLFWCVGLAGFWLTEIGFLFEAVRIVIIALSGGIFPLAVFGPGAERVLALLPFRFTIQFPTELLCGRIPLESVAPSFAVAVFWILALTALSQIVWRRGIRRFAAVGS